MKYLNIQLSLSMGLRKCKESSFQAALLGWQSKVVEMNGGVLA